MSAHKLSGSIANNALLTIPTLALCLSATAAFADVRFTLRGGQAFTQGDEHMALSDDASLGRVEASAAVALTPHLSLGGFFASGSFDDSVHDELNTALTRQTLGLTAAWSTEILPWLVGRGRMGPTITWLDVTVEDSAWDGESFHAEDWELGLLAGAGVDLYLSRLLPSDQLDGIDLGLSLELNYERIVPMDVEAKGTDLGSYDASGPGWLAGAFVRF